MISTKNCVFDISDVPREWVFEHYLNLSEKLTGQDVKMLSIFSSKDRVPSMFVYFNTHSACYKYKDFSSGNQGDHIDLVMRMFNLTTRQCGLVKIINDYGEFIKYHDKYENTGKFKIPAKYKVTDYLIRHWTTLDAKYWTAYHITSNNLDKYNIAPLNHYTMEKENPNKSISKISINGRYIYGYFKKDGTLYKVYQPKNKKKKFLKVIDYVQGSEQLTFKRKYLVITSSLKDLLSFNTLNIIDMESIAPDSENTMLPKHLIEKYKEKYEKIIVLFDNDAAGIRSMHKYEERYNVSSIILDMEDDIAHAVKMHGPVQVRNKLLPLIKQVING